MLLSLLENRLDRFLPVISTDGRDAIVPVVEALASTSPSASRVLAPGGLSAAYRPTCSAA